MKRMQRVLNHHARFTVSCENKFTKLKISKEIGKLLGKKLKEKGVFEAVFDRNGFSYKGRVAALADGVRESGLKF